MMNRVSLLILLLMGIVSPERILARTIRLTSSEWAPHFGKNLPNGGYITELVTESFRVMGYETVVHFYPWARALKYVENGVYHGLIGAFYSKERAEYCLFSEPVSVENTMMFVQSSSDFEFKAVGNLTGLKIGVERGVITGNRDFDHNPLIFKSPAARQITNIRKLIAGRIDGIADGEKAILYAAQSDSNETLSKIKRLYPPLSINNLYVCFSKKVENVEKILRDFNQGLEKIKEKGIRNSILKKHDTN